MDIKDTVNRVAELSRLKFNVDELDKFANQFSNMLTYVSVIDKLDVDGVEPLSHVNDDENEFREDISKPSLSSEEAI
jgi:aspartyl-tRNA(Asn)/glutamyl-tRNA(Gln) amidotransferase subunit C